MKVLVADDHPLLREALGQVLRELDTGLVLREAADGLAVRRCLAEDADLDLILLDLCLPSVRGLELFEAIRRDYPMLPVVVLSGLDDVKTVRAVLAGGALGFIPKSSSHAVMLNALRLILAGGRYLPPELIAPALDRDALASTGSTRAPLSVTDLGLTERQREVLVHLAQGRSNKEICRKLGLAEPTVKIHVSAILKALDVRTRTQAVVRINELGLRLDEPMQAATGEAPRGH
ncbi:MAG: response regulator transcription factor [Sphingobacteriia bacterium]|nr:response regulator transcription factor [Sphingobacteriia bacterium]NCC39761.1 response regulator transcription factor [Gammaproteobacteria bacterium]